MFRTTGSLFRSATKSSCAKEEGGSLHRPETALEASPFCSKPCSRTSTWKWRWWGCASRSLWRRTPRYQTTSRRGSTWRRCTIGMSGEGQAAILMPQNLFVRAISLSGGTRWAHNPTVVVPRLDQLELFAAPSKVATGEGHASVASSDAAGRLKKLDVLAYISSQRGGHNASPSLLALLW